MKTRTLLALVSTLLVGATLFAAPTAENTPDKFVRYVEATGSQYVDTGIVGRYNTKAECKVEWMNLADTAFLASGYYSGNKRFYACWCSTADGNMFTAQGTGDKVNNGQDLLFEKKRIYTYTTDFSAKDANNMSTNTVSVDGSKVFSKAYNALDTGTNLYVFANNQFGTAAGFSKTRCYGLTIWQGSAGGGAMSKVREFKPCVKNGRAGLYDTVSETIFYSGSDADLTYDENCDVPDAFIDYVESFGNSYIDTGVTGKSGTSAKMEVVLKHNYDNALLASRDGSNRFYLIHNGGSSKWGYGYGAFSSFGSFVLDKKYYVESSLASGSQVIKIGEDGPDGATTTYINAANTTPIDTGRSMYIFCCNQSGSALEKKYWGKARVYWLQIFQDGEMVRDFRPCLKYGEAALYDDVSKTIFYPEGDPLGYDNSVVANADELVFVDYIESDGFTHLDTQVAANSPTRATGVFSWTQMRTTNEEKQYLDENHHSYLACGCYNSDSDANRFYMIDQTEQYFWVGYGNNKEKWSSIGKAAVDVKYFFDISFAAGSQPFTLARDGGATTNSYTWTWSGGASGCSNLYLFACNDAKNKKPIYRSAARCYGLTIYQGGETPVRNFKPCIKDGQAALYDTVSQRLFYPIPAIPAEGNTGAVTDESALSPVDAYLEYVETDGTQYIDTGVIGRDGTVIEFIETCLKDTDSERCLIGARGSNENSRFYMWYHGNIWTLGFGYGATYWRPSLSDPNTPASQWSADYEDCYRLRNGDTSHARVSFAAGLQTVTIFDDINNTRSVISARTLAGPVDTDRNLYLFANNIDGTASAFAKTRFQWLKIKQDRAWVRKFQPVRLRNGLVGLWDFVEEKTYLPKTASGGFVAFSAVGPETGKIFKVPFSIVIR